MARSLPIDIWSDVVCPWCAIGKRRLEAALATFPHKDDVTVTWHAFELDPSAPKRVTEGNVERLAKKYGRTPEQARAMIQNVIDTGARDGLDLRLFEARGGNTFDAHRLIRAAAERGVQSAVKERLLRGYMTDGADIGDPETLVRLASEAGLDAEEARAVLASDQYAKEVREDEGAARSLGVQGVPFFVLGRKYAISGAQPVEVFQRALAQAWDEASAEVDAAAEGAACGVDGKDC